MAAAVSTSMAADIGDMSALKYTNSADFCEHELKIGYNIGNQFDATIRGLNFKAPEDASVEWWETLWTNPPVRREYIQELKRYGVQLIRLPVSWYVHMDKDGRIDAKWMARIKEVVDMIIAEDMYVIVNIHHDGMPHDKYKKLVFDEERREENAAYLRLVWKQIGTAFKDYGTHLIFESFNEVSDSSKSMSPNEKRCRETTIQNQVFIDTIRGLGGKNAQRYLLCAGYAGLALQNLDELKDTVPGRLMRTKHVYEKSCKHHFPKSNRTYGTIIGEIGGTFGRIDQHGDENPRGIREKADRTYGTSTCWWDNGQTCECGLLNRKTLGAMNPLTLAGYFGKDASFLKIDKVPREKLATKECPNVAIFACDEPLPSGKRYFALASAKPIQRVVPYGKYPHFMSAEGMCDGWVTEYESDDGKTFNKLACRWCNDFMFLKWHHYELAGMSGLAYQIAGNYLVPEVGHIGHGWKQSGANLIEYPEKTVEVKPGEYYLANIERKDDHTPSVRFEFNCLGADGQPVHYKDEKGKDRTRHIGGTNGEVVQIPEGVAKLTITIKERHSSRNNDGGERILKAVQEGKLKFTFVKLIPDGIHTHVENLATGKCFSCGKKAF